MAGLHSGRVPANGVRAKHDVMCADRFPLLAEDRRLLPLRRREPRVTLPSRLGCSGETVGRGFLLCRRQGGKSKRTTLPTLSTWGSWALSKVSAPSASHLYPCKGQEVACGPCCSSQPPCFGPLPPTCWRQVVLPSLAFCLFRPQFQERATEGSWDDRGSEAKILPSPQK